VEDARIGKLIELKIIDSDAGNVRERVNDMCKKLLANSVIEDFVVKVEE
jgi:phosphoribosylformylglycinamidine synthase